MSADRAPRVLFDLDGTLVDTAPDLHAAMAWLQRELGVPQTPAEAFRRVVSRGGRAMLALGLPMLDEDERERLLPRFLDRYRQGIAEASRPYEGVAEVLGAIEGAGGAWGVVTNKPERLARPLVEALGWSRRCAVLVGGDTLPRAKPHPDPLLEACRHLGIAAAQALYVGDDRRDVEAARAAGMPVVAAAWGYRTEDDRIEAWGADAVLAAPIELLGRLSERWK